jgi:hypothetical protein
LIALFGLGVAVSIIDEERTDTLAASRRSFTSWVAGTAILLFGSGLVAIFAFAATNLGPTGPH